MTFFEQVCLSCIFLDNIDIPKDSNGNTKSNTSLGQKVHKEYKSDLADGITKIKEYTLPSGKRVDYIDFESKTIYELKPNNPTQIAKGQKQLAGYKAEVEQEFGGEWTTVLDTY